jgi:hypothetical protein
MLFFFDTDDGQRRIADGAGIDLPDAAEVVEQAVAMLRDLSHAGVGAGGSRTFSVRVRGADGEGAYAASLQLKVDSLA